MLKKRYFFFLVVFLILFIGINSFSPPILISEETDKSLSAGQLVYKKLIDFIEEGKRLNKEAINLDSKDLSVLKGNKNPFTLFYIHQKEGSLLSGLNGYGNWVSLPFGRARLISCQSGTQGSALIKAAVQIYLSPDFYLTKPEITPFSENSLSPKSFYPLSNEISGNFERIYTNNIFFPITYPLTSFEKETELWAFLKLNVCKGNNCRSYSFPLVLNLSSDENFITPFCPKIEQTFHKVPLKNSNEILIEKAIKEFPFIYITLQLKEEVSFIKVFPEHPGTWTSSLEQINGNKVVVKLKARSKENFETAPIILYLSLPNGLFELSISPSNGAHTPIQNSFPIGFLFLSGICLFIFSPFFWMACIYKGHSQKSTRSFLLKASYLFIFLGIGYSFLWQIGIISPFALYKLHWLFGICILFFLIGLIFDLPEVSLAEGIFIFCLIPKPYLDLCLNNFPTFFWAPLLIGSIWTLCFSLFFILGYFFLPFLLKFQKYFSKKNRFLIARLPFIILLIWCIIGLMTHSFIPSSSFLTFEKINQDIQEDKTLFISIEENFSFQAFLNKVLFRFNLSTLGAYRRGQFNIYSVSSKSTFGKKLIQTKKIQFLPVNLLFNKSTPEGLLLPQQISPSLISEYIQSIR